MNRSLFWYSKKLRELNSMMTNISLLLAKVNLSNLQSTITHTLGIINDFVDVDRTYIFKYDFNNKTCSNTFEYCRGGISAQIHNLQNVPLEMLSDWVTKHYSNEAWYIKDVTKLQDDQMREHLDSQGIKSLLVIPLYDMEELYGFLGFDSVRKKKTFNRLERIVLYDFAKLLTSSIKRYETYERYHYEKERADLLAKSAVIGSWEWNLKTDSLIINEVWANIVGYTLDELKPVNINTWKNLVHPIDLAYALNEIKEITEGKKDFYSVEFRMLHKNGTYVWVRAVGKVIDWIDDEPQVILGSHVEIDQFKKKEQEFKTLSQAINYSPSTIVVTDSESRIQFVNPKFEETTGYKTVEVIGKNPRILKSGYHDNAFYENMYKTLTSGKVWTGELYNKRRDGTFYWESASIAPVYDNEKNLTHFVAIISDISEKKRVEENLNEYRKKLEDEVNSKMREIEDSQQAAIIALAKLTEARDKDTGSHVERVQYLCKALASSLQDNEKYRHLINLQFLNDIYFASALHDIGKIDIPDSVLLKPGKLTIEEFEIIKSHVKTGDDILSDMVKFYPKASLVLMGRIIAKYHHEKWNGEGYLSGIKGDEIPLPARIMALVDVYDALRSKRPYKEPMSHQMAYDIIVNDSGKHFDPDIVDAFIRIHEQFDAIFNSLSKS